MPTFSGNKQCISAGNLTTNDRVALLLMDDPNQARLKILGHARIVDAGADPALEARVSLPGYPGRLERVIRIDLVAFNTAHYAASQPAGSSGCAMPTKSRAQPAVHAVDDGVLVAAVVAWKNQRSAGRAGLR